MGIDQKVQRCENNVFFPVWPKNGGIARAEAGKVCWGCVVAGSVLGFGVCISVGSQWGATGGFFVGLK